MSFVGIQDDKEEWLKSELPALEQLYTWVISTKYTVYLSKHESTLAFIDAMLIEFSKEKDLRPCCMT